jgi:hypothetical protein
VLDDDDRVLLILHDGHELKASEASAVVCIIEIQ